MGPPPSLHSAHLAELPSPKGCLFRPALRLWAALGACVHFPRVRAPRPRQILKWGPTQEGVRSPPARRQAQPNNPQPAQSTSHAEQGARDGHGQWAAAVESWLKAPSKVKPRGFSPGGPGSPGACELQQEKPL